jgi:hypothetical protein
MLDAMAKINKAAALDTIYLALDAPDYLVRKKALELLDDPELINKNPYVNSVLKLARENHKHEVWPYDPKTGTKLGQVLNTDADYRRASSRKNGRVKAIVTTEQGVKAALVNLCRGYERGNNRRVDMLQIMRDDAGLIEQIGPWSASRPVQ